jgi:hypothetical protein
MHSFCSQLIGVTWTGRTVLHLVCCKNCRLYRRLNRANDLLYHVISFQNGATLKPPIRESRFLCTSWVIHDETARYERQP